ncbi:hypothetical protein [Pseudomonas viridiflava]|uniref:hypothetical protein n=1 Tax=Pseudomonas viridiflava TaxID=33069 RepID=UPI0013CE79D2|nr:hypothetical protein [Pseudomonas viridiflava]
MPAIDGTTVKVALHYRAGRSVGQIALPAATKVIDLEMLRKLGAWRAKVVA